VNISIVSLPCLVKVAASSVRPVAMDFVICTGPVEEHHIRRSTESLAFIYIISNSCVMLYVERSTVDLKVLPDPYMAVSFAGMVEGR
jgi:hypothetical protein